MRCEIFRDHEAEIRQYCEDNDLSYSKAASSVLSWDKKEVFVCDSTPNPERGRLGLMDNIPMPVALEIYLEDDNTLRFEQTEFTRLYLGSENKVPVEAELEVAEPAMA